MSVASTVVTVEKLTDSYGWVVVVTVTGEDGVVDVQKSKRYLSPGLAEKRATKLRKMLRSIDSYRPKRPK